MNVCMLSCSLHNLYFYSCYITPFLTWSPTPNNPCESLPSSSQLLGFTPWKLFSGMISLACSLPWASLSVLKLQERRQLGSFVFWAPRTLNSAQNQAALNSYLLNNRKKKKRWVREMGEWRGKGGIVLKLTHRTITTRLPNNNVNHYKTLPPISIQVLPTPTLAQER